MAIQSIQTHIWSRVEPLIAPAAVGMGVTLVVQYVYGTVAACCFGAVLVGVGIEFRDLITQVSKNEVFVGVARLVAMAVLPLFGTWGIVASVGIAAFSSFTLDIRLYSIRQKLKEADAIIQEIQKERLALQEELKKITLERDQNNSRLDEFWKGRKPVEEISKVIDRYEALVDQNQKFLQTKLDKSDYTAAEGILADITKFKAFIEQTKKETLQLHATVQAIAEKIEAYVNK